MTAMSLREAVGSLLVVGLESTTLSATERAWLRVVRPTGLILFRRNIADAQQTRALLQSASGECAAHVMRCVDLEGGTVDRLRDALAPMPSAQAVARHRNAALAREQGQLTARAVRLFGMNTTLAPVLDLGLAESAPILGTRTAAPDATGVTAYARAFLSGLRSMRVTGCGKHFPGLGGGTLDSHLQMPEIARSWEQLQAEDLEPYRALRRQLPMVMISHAAYPLTIGGTVPASQSRYWMQEILRDTLDYRGLIFSDDMEMGGVLGARPMEEAVLTAVEAGMDVMEICHREELILRGFESLLREAEQSAAFRRRVMRQARRVAAWRKRQYGSLASASESIPANDLAAQEAALREEILAFGRRVSPEHAG